MLQIISGYLCTHSLMSLISSIQIHVSPMKDEVSAFIPEFSAEIYQRISYLRLEKNNNRLHVVHFRWLRQNGSFMCE